MINYKDNYILSSQNQFFELALFSIIGDRAQQQDRVGYDINETAGIVVLCDGMGGHEGGQLASNIAVEEFIEAYRTYDFHDTPQMFLLKTIGEVDKKITSLRNLDNSKMKAGTTLSAVLIDKKNLFWVSVGDSRIYVYRKNEFVQATKDHNYKMVLDEKKSSGHISEREYFSEIRRGNVLVSFLGVNGLPYVENNSAPLRMLTDDIVVLVSDGIYKLLSDDEIKHILEEEKTLEDVLKKVHVLTQKKAKNNNVKQDNISIAIIKIK